MDYRVNESDLVGELGGFPIEAAEKMVECQVRQGNKADVSVFVNDLTCNKNFGGFNWGETEEGFVFLDICN